MNWEVFVLSALGISSLTALGVSAYLAQDIWIKHDLARKWIAWLTFAAFILGASTWAGLATPYMF